MTINSTKKNTDFPIRVFSCLVKGSQAIEVKLFMFDDRILF